METSPLLILLPGLEGTGTLFEPFIRCLPEGVQAQVIGYPTDTRLTYLDLEMFVREQLPRDQPYVIVAESFSGPLGIRLATKPAGDLRGLVLVSTFTSAPLGRIGQYFTRLPIELICLIRPPKWLMRLFLLSPTHSETELHSFRKALTSVKPSVLAVRVRETLTVNVEAELRRCRAPVIAIFAEDDRLINGQARETICDCCPDAYVANVLAPHLLLQTAPEAVVRLLEDRGIIWPSS